jgi:two-component system cell cycle sensor histidine kinase/response regulator CckA
MAPPRKKAKAPVRPARPSRVSRELAALAEALAALPDAAVITRDRWKDGGAEIVQANPAFAALTGHAAASLPGQNTRLLHGRKTDMPQRDANRWLEAGEGWLHRKDDTPFYATWRFSLLGGAPGIRLGVYRDMSEMHQLQEALLHSQKLDAVGQLAGGVAHDINNLLAIINGYCEIMSGKLAAVPAAQKDLQEIHRAGLKAVAITRQILEFSRRKETEAGVVNANTLVREIAGILHQVMGDAVKIELRLASDLGNMRVDPTQFQQVLLNLCFNAREAMPQGGKLSVRTSRQAAETRTGLATPGWVVVHVADTGAGMAPAVQRRIFEPFFTTKPRGTGLGLTTVLGIVKRAGGAISVQSTAGSGTTFEMKFPETPEPEQPAGATLAALPATDGSEAIWLVEPDVLLRKMVSGILAVDGYKLTEFAEPGEAMAATPANWPALLLVDGSVKQAVELAVWLRERNRRLCVLNVSAGAPGAAWRDLPAKTCGHLPKPFALSTLLHAVRGLLDAGR